MCLTKWARFVGRIDMAGKGISYSTRITHTLKWTVGLFQRKKRKICFHLHWHRFQHSGERDLTCILHGFVNHVAKETKAGRHRQDPCHLLPPEPARTCLELSNFCEDPPAPGLPHLASTEYRSPWMVVSPKNSLTPAITAMVQVAVERKVPFLCVIARLCHNQVVL